VHIGGANFICRNSIIVEDDVTMAWGITIYDHNSHSINWEERRNDNQQCYNDYLDYNGNNIYNKNWSNVVDKPIKIESKVWIGFDVTILKGVTIGEGAVIGAKSVVVKDVEPWTVVAGNPAIIVKYLPEYKKK
jgi:acetyltransferase-like isoleucine patch superfamily enzyme